jgi:hypothetical protein
MKPRVSAVTAQVVGLGLVVLLLAAHAAGLAPAVRVPLAILVFLVVPGVGLVLALRLPVDMVTAGGIALGVSVGVDLLVSRLLLLLGRADVTAVLAVLAAFVLCCLVSTLRYERQRP